MPIQNNPSLAPFRQAISKASEQRPSESAPKISKSEIKKAIELLPSDATGLAAARDLLENSAVRLTPEAKSSLQDFIDASQSPAALASGAPVFSSSVYLQAGIQMNPTNPAETVAKRFEDVGYSRKMAKDALADLGMDGLSRSDSVHVGDVSDGPLGSFFVDVKVSHFMNADDVRADLRLQVSAGGKLIQASERPEAVAPTPEPEPTVPTNPTDAIAARFEDVGYARFMAQEAMSDLGLGHVNRSTAVHVGDITEGPMGTFFADLKVTHFMNANDVKADVRLQLDADGRYMSASERTDPVAPTPVPEPVAPTNPADEVAARFEDVGYAHTMATEALADLGLAGLSRSDAVHVGEVSDGPMGSFFVKVKVTNFMNANDVRADLRLQVSGGGLLISASED